MHGCSCKKLILPILFCLVLAGCATIGRGTESEPELSGFIPGGCSAYLSGKLLSLPPMFTDILSKSGIPDKVLKNTDRIYCCFDNPSRMTVFFQGDYSKLHAKNYFNMKKQFEKRREGIFDYYIDKESGAGVCLPSDSIIIYTEFDMAELLRSYNPDGRNLDADFDKFFTGDIFMFRDNPVIEGLDAKFSYCVFLNAVCEQDLYVVDTDMCFDSARDSKVMSPVIKLFILNLLKKNGIVELNGRRQVTVSDNRVLLRGLRIPTYKSNAFFEYFISEFENR